MCAHGSFKTVAECRPREGFGFALRVQVTCVECGTPLRFSRAALPPGASELGVVLVGVGGLVAELVCEAAGD